MATHVEISKRLVAINSASTVARHLVSITVLVWLQQYLIRRIPAEEYSLLPIVMAVMVFAPLLSTVLTGGISRYVIHAAARGDERGVTQVVSTILPLLIGAAVLVFGVIGTVTWFVGDILNIAPDQLDDARLMLGVTLLSFCIRLCFSPFHLGFHVRQKFLLRNIIELGSELLFITILFSLLFGVGVRVLWIPVARFATKTCEEVVIVIISRRLVPALRFRFSEFRRSLLRELLSFGGWNLLGQVAGMLAHAANPIILNKGASAAELTAYHIGTIPHRSIPGLMDEAIWPLFPALTAMHATGDNKRLATTYLRGGRLALWIVMLICTPLIVFAQDIFLMYLGQEKFSEYSSTFAVTILTLASYPTFYGRILLGYIAGAMDRLPAYTIAMLVRQVCCAALAIYFVFDMQLGAVGCAFAVLIGGAIVDITVIWPIGLNLLSISLGTFLRKTLIPGLIPMTAAVLFGMQLRSLVYPESWLMIGSLMVLVAMVYLLVLTVFCMKPEDRRDLNLLLSKVPFLKT
jgi:O-antigen/teichoic acid export membrane protein